MKKIVIAIILTLTFLGQTFACLNGKSMALKNGLGIYVDARGKVPYGHKYLTDDFEKEVNVIDSFYKATKDLDYLSDKGILLILLKRYNEAIDLYLKIEKLEPSRYSTASNIGTAYELAGQNKDALKWIKRAVEIDPTSHNSSEWIHVNILKAKIKGEQYYTTDFLLNTHFGSGDEPYSGLPEDELSILHNALYYQLNERVSFLKSRDVLVAQLLFDLGNIAFELGRYDDAKLDYEQAQKYGFIGDLIDARIEASIRMAESKKRNTSVNKKTKSVDWSNAIFQFLKPAVVLVLIWALLFFIYKRYKK
jgi:tetratricopeptide (TPR) repeat protein